MNKERRERLSTAKQHIDAARAALDAAREIVAECQADEREFFDNMPEGFQNGERGQRADAAADALQEVVDSIEAFDLNELDSNIDSAMEG